MNGTTQEKNQDTDVDWTFNQTHFADICKYRGTGRSTWLNHPDSGVCL